MKVFGFLGDFFFKFLGEFFLISLLLVFLKYGQLYFSKVPNSISAFISRPSEVKRPKGPKGLQVDF